MQLTDEHIQYISKDLHYRGIVAEGVDEELHDHICSAVEVEMKGGAKFIPAYQKVLRQFGHTAGLRQTQQQILQSNPTKMMIKNYLLIAARSLRKNSFYSLINVLGLAVGVAATLVIVLFIADELSYDRHFTHANRIYRIDADAKFGGREIKMTYRSAPEAQALLETYPEIESAVRFRALGSYLVKPVDGVENIKEKNVAWTDSSFFHIFDVPVLEGVGRDALSQPGSVAISRALAEKYFPGKSAIDQSLILDNKYHTTVKAVYENLPANTHFHFDILISMAGDWPVAREAKSTSFLNENFQTYLLLKPGVGEAMVESKLSGFIERHLGPELIRAFGNDFTFEKLIAAGNKYDLRLTPLTDIHLYSNLVGEFEPNGNISYVYLLSIVAGFVLLIGCINFMNLSTARSANRAKEVGVRKVLGSLRSHLVRQFLMESALITLFSFLVGLVLVYFFLPVFNNLSQKQLTLPLSSPIFYGMLLLGSTLVAVLAGVYPAFFLSAFKPVNVLKGRNSLGTQSGFIRSGLVVFQFGISVLLIVGALSVNKQLHFIQNKKLGFEKDQVIIVHDGYALRPNNAQPFKDQVLQLNTIESGTISGFIPVESDWSWRSHSSFWKEGTEASTDNTINTQTWNVDYDYIPTFKMSLKAGRNFDRAFQTDNEAVILNEAATKQFDLGHEPIGKKIHYFDGPPEAANIRTATIIGVVEDFHFSSMKETIMPLALMLGQADGTICFRFNAANVQEVITSIESIWKKLAPGQPFSYSFLNEDFEHMYLAEQRLTSIFTLFAGLTIIIACLGLFALTAFTAEQRTREIGIRKVLGASVFSIVTLLSKEFGRLIFIAIVVATPIAWYLVSWWLSDYTYKVNIGWTVYLLSGLVALVVALATTSFQSIKAATCDPVKSLRSE